MSTAFRDTACVAVGGGVGSVLRELLMLGVADLPGGSHVHLHRQCRGFGADRLQPPSSVPDGPVGATGKLLLTTGVMGGMSTFNSLIWGTQQMLMNRANAPRASSTCFRAW